MRLKYTLLKDFWFFLFGVVFFNVRMFHWLAFVTEEGS